MKLIEANQAKEFASTFLADKILQAAVNAVLDNAPGFELVRCKDCKWCSHNTPDGFHWCDEHERGSLCDDDFCSYGERRAEHERNNNS